MARKSKTKLTAWDAAKPILLQAYVTGKITDNQSPMEVYNMPEHIEFRDVVYERFRTNFNNLKKRVRRFKDSADEHEVMLLHDLRLYDLAEDTEGCWDGSDAQKLLEKDIIKKRHLKYKPEILWLRRDAYQKFTLKVFRGHIHQILRRDLETPYWTYKKAKKVKKAEAKFTEQDHNELDAQERAQITQILRELG